MDVLVRVPGCVSLHFPPFYFSCCFFVLFCFFEICVSDFSSIFHDLNVHFFLRFFSLFCHFSFFVFFILVIFHDLNVQFFNFFHPFLNFRHFHFCHFHVS